MQFLAHRDLHGKHAFLSASKYSWIRYDDLKLEEVYKNHEAAMIGSQFHDLASQLIRLGVKLPRTQKTLNQFVNDVIGFHMNSEQILFYSDNIFGTADAIAFRKNKLMIFDLKTGVIAKASMDQLLIYAAIFCLEYGVKPADIEIELRIYQNDEVLVLEPLLEDIIPIMDKIVRFDQKIEMMKAEAELP